MTNRIEYIHSQRVGNKRIPVTAYGEDASKCYTWSIQGSKQPRKDGVKMVYYVCSGCRSVRVQGLVPKSRILPTRKADATTDMWIDLEPNNEHFCEPRNLSEVKGIAIRRSMQAELATGSREPVGAAVIRMESKITTKFSVETKEICLEIRQAAVANRPAVSQALKRARRKRYPTIADYMNLEDEENGLLCCTLRGSLANGLHYGERILLLCSDVLLVFCSPRNMYTLRHSEDLVCDGSFKYSPLGTYQVYLVFAFVKRIHSTPVVTALLKKKDKKTYRRMWRALAEVFEYSKNKIKYTHFDNEPAAYKSFQRQVPDIAIKMCAFHVKQALNRQLTPTLVYRHAILLIIDLIKENFGEDTVVFEKLNNLLE